MVLYYIILDTNFLLIPAQFGIDIFSEIEKICHLKYELCIVDKTVDELDKIINTQKGKSKRAAKLALSLLKAKNLKRIVTTDSEKDVDNLILDIISAKKGYIVATLDKELRDKIKEKQVPVICLRSKKYLMLKMYT